MDTRRAFLLGLTAGAAAPLWPSVASATKPAQDLGAQIARAAEAQVGVTLYYDPAYVKLAYPMGDVPAERGVCADVVIRALRGIEIDLQQAVHEDMAAHFSAYPKTWGLTKPDKNIDHRRVLNLETYFRRKGASLEANGYDDPLRPGDLVTWRLPGNLPHIGVAARERSADDSHPLIVHNVGAGTRKEDVLFSWPIVDCFRFPWRK